MKLYLFMNRQEIETWVSRKLISITLRVTLGTNLLMLLLLIVRLADQYLKAANLWYS